MSENEIEKRFLTEDEKREKFLKVWEIIEPCQSKLYMLKNCDTSLKSHIELILKHPKQYALFPLSPEDVGYIKGYVEGMKR